jgi:Flp pilus assembly protein TadG
MKRPYNEAPKDNRRRSGDERGSASVWMVLIASGIFLAVLGLVYDGGQVLNERAHAKQVAEQAARAGVDQLGALRNGQDLVDPVAATVRAQQILKQAGWTGTVTVNGNQVTVEVTGEYSTIFLPIVGISHLRIDQIGSAQAAFQARP